MKFNYTKRVYFVTMGTFHMAILLLFNNGTSLPFAEIAENTQLPEKELIKQLQALVDAKILEVEVRQDQREEIILEKHCQADAQLKILPCYDFFFLNSFYLLNQSDVNICSAS